MAQPDLLGSVLGKEPSLGFDIERLSSAGDGDLASLPDGSTS